MTSLKKLTAVFLAVLTLISLAVISVCADENSSSEAQLTVKVSSNIGSDVSEIYDTQTDTAVKVCCTLTAVPLFANIQGYVAYDKNTLQLQDISLSDRFPAPVYNKDLDSKASFNSTSDDNNIDFTQGGTFLTVTFKILTAGETNVALTIEELNGLSQQWTPYGIITDGVLVRPDDISGSAELRHIPETVDTKVTLKAAKTKIFVGDSTTVSATVDYGVGQTTYTTSDSKVAEVNAVTGKVTGKSEGTAYIIATNNGMSNSVKITVVRRANPLKVSAKKLTVKVKAKKTAFTKTKVFKISGAKGKLTFKKKSGSKLVTISKTTGKVVVKKGLKKGKTYTIRFNVRAAGGKAYKAKSKTVSVKIKVK